MLILGMKILTKEIEKRLRENSKNPNGLCSNKNKKITENRLNWYLFFNII
jgi:hypothetical protein